MRRGSRPGLVSRDHLDKAALVVAFLAGAAGSWGAKALGFGPFVAVAWTVGAMGFYVAAVTLLGRLRIEPEAIGDNCYYLGFLLTLSSLSATLYQLTGSGEEAELMRSIIGGFGIALVSTILGILLRVIFIQLRPDIVARDRETRIELQRAARELRLELAASVAAMKAFSTEAIQLAAEQGARAHAAAEAAAEAQRARMQADAEAQAAMLGRTLEAAGAEAVRAIGESVGASAEAAQAAIAGSLGEMSRAIGEFAAAQAAAVDAREANEARAAAVGDKALARAGAVAAEVEALGARVSVALEKLARELGESAAAIEAAGEAAGEAARAAKAAGDGRPWPFALWRS